MPLKIYPILLLLLAASPAMASEAPVAASTGGMFQVLLVLFAVLGLMAGAAWLLKKFQVRGTTVGGTIRIVGGVAVGSRERIMVVEVADQWIVVGVTANNINALTTLPKQETPQVGDADPADNFAKRLKQFIEKRNAN